MRRLFSVFRIALIEQLRSPGDLLLTLTIAPLFVWMYWSFVGGGSTYFDVLVINNDRGVCPLKPLEGAAQIHKEQTCAAQVIERMAALSYESGQPLLKITLVTDREAAEKRLRSRSVEALLIFSPDFTASLQGGQSAVSPQVTFVGDLNNPYYSPAAVLANSVLESYVREAIGQPLPIVIAEQPISNSASRTEFEIYVPGLLICAGTMMLFSVAIAITRQVESGVVRRLRLTRLSALDFIGGMSLLYVLISLLAVWLSFLTAQILGFRSQGPAWAAVLIYALTAVATVGVGLVTACFCRTTARAAILVNFPLFLLLFFSGAVFPLGNPTLFTLGGRAFGLFDLLPQTHATNALNKILSLGAGFQEVLFEVAALAVLSVIYFLLGVILFKRLHLRGES